MTTNDTRRGTGTRGIVAFDNSGTLSDPVVAGTDTGDDPTFQQPVPEIPPGRSAALVSVALDEYDAFERDAPLGAVVDEEEFPVGLALSNVATAPEAAREAVVADDAVPARVVTDRVDELIGRVGSEFQGEPPIGVQLVVDLDAGRIHRVLAYTTVPRAVAVEVVDAVREAGYVPHIVSGDADHILRTVAEELAVPDSNVHPYQSANDKAETLAGLRGTDGDVVMVGDYVNDRFALDAADLGILVDEDGDAEGELVDAADDTVPTIEDVPGVLHE